MRRGGIGTGKRAGGPKTVRLANLSKLTLVQNAVSGNLGSELPLAAPCVDVG